MYRSPGTASSPDLATLMRKVRDSEQPREEPILEQPWTTSRARTESTASSAFEFIDITPFKTHLNKSRDEALTSPDIISDDSPPQRKSQHRLAKSEKTLGIPKMSDQMRRKDAGGEDCFDREGNRSMRGRTNAFFGELLSHSQGSISDKNRADSSSTPTPVSTQHHIVPLVSAIPLEYRQAASTSPPAQPPAQPQFVDAQTTNSPAQPPNLSAAADPFTVSRISGPSQSSTIPPTRHTKHLPPINKQFPPAPVDDHSDSEDDIPLAGPHTKPRPVDTRPKTSADGIHDCNQTTLTQRRQPRSAFPRQSKDGRRWSMSVGDIDVQKLVLEARARAEAKGEQVGPTGLRIQAAPKSAPLPRTSMDVAPPRASVDHVANHDDSDEDRTEEGLPPNAPAQSPMDQRRMSRRAQAVNAWAKDMELSTLVDGFGGELQDALGGIRASPARAQFPGAFPSSSAGRGPGVAYTIRPVKPERVSSDNAPNSLGRQLPASPLATRRLSTASSASSSSILAVLGSLPVGERQGLPNQPSTESMRTASSETAGAYIAPPSPTILDSGSTPPVTSPIMSAGRSLPIPGSSATMTGMSTLSSSLPPRSSSLRLSPRALPRRQPPLHRSAASASESPLIKGAALGTSIRLVSDQVQLRKDRSRERVRRDRLVSDPVVSAPNPGTWNEDNTGLIAKIDRRSSTGAASVDIEGRGQSLAARCWQEDETFLAKEKIAEWLGETPAINKVALRYYMDYFNFTGMRLDAAFRHLCTKLYLKAKTQQVDRILEEFSRRFWDCNRGSVYGSSSIVHAISYSLLLLNTDLHVAELSSHMSKTQFIRNTWAVIQDQIRAPEMPKSPASGTGSNGIGDPLKSPIILEHGRGQDHSRFQSHVTGESTPELILDKESSHPGDGLESVTRKQRSGSLNSWRSGSREGGQLSLNASNPNMMDSDPKTPTGSMHAVVSARGWDSEMEMLLKDMYNSVKNQQILQPLTGLAPQERQSMTLSPGDRITSLKRGSIRGLQSLLETQNPYRSNSSVDGRISPPPSFATSIGEGVQQSSSNLFAPTLGFASNLSHTIIKEAQEDDVRSVKSDMTNSTTLSITDEELALLGPPWAKEGMLCRKQYWESAGKRAKVKTWMDVFVVIQKGELSMFVFGDSGSGGNSGGGVTVGGGNWLSNANCVGKVVLAHALAHSLAPPGYNRQRPHCFVLTLASGALFFFQAGTEDLVNEWVMTCNYWAARQSKEPLSGGVSNMEYGWNRALEMLQSANAEAISERRVDSSGSQSMRSERNVNLRIPQSPFNSERIIIHEWTGLMHSVMPSTHDEETQMEALQKQANLLKQELHVHNELRQPMMSLYAPRSANAIKASSNWERRSQYLLSEILKYDSYVESMRSAMSQRLKRRGEKALERALGVSNPDDEELEGVVYSAPAITKSGPAARIDPGMNSARAGRQQVIHYTPRPPATPVVVPPTPAANPDDDEPSDRRRSMYRSPGTASSPDLATLMRKVRDSERPREGSIPEQPADRARTKSTASSTFDSAFEFIENSPAKTPLKPSRDRAVASPDTNSDGSPLQRKSQRRLAKPEESLAVPDGYSDVDEGRSDREGKRSMRDKTSAFFGKMLGHTQGSIRDKNAASTSSPAQLPAQPQFVDAQITDSPVQTPNLSVAADPFTASRASGPSQSSTMPPTRHTSPLPPINKQYPPAPVDDRPGLEDDIPLAGPGAKSRLADARPKTSTDGMHDYDQTTLIQRRQPSSAFPRQSNDGGRQNMSIGDVDVQKQVLETRTLDTHRTIQPLSEEVVISSLMSASDIVIHLGDHGCENITDHLDMSSCSNYPISSGGFGDVYRGRLIDGTPVAIKTMRIQLNPSESGQKPLKHAALELHTWSKCRHPNVVELLGAAEFRDQIGMVSLWMENGSLPSFLAKHPDVDRCQLSLQISEGLAYLHYRNIIHGDLKGLNILISNTGTPLLADFGNAVLQGRTLQFTNTTPKNSISPRWAAPEIIKGSGTYSFSADVYALGMTILETITGQVPYSEKVDLAVFFAVAVNRELPKRPEGQIPLDSQQGNALWSMLTRCWAFEAETRPRADDVVDVMKTVTREALMRPTSGAVLESNAGASAVPTTRGEHLTWVARQLRETPVDSPNPTSPP